MSGGWEGEALGPLCCLVTGNVCGDLGIGLERDRERLVGRRSLGL